MILYVQYDIIIIQKLPISTNSLKKLIHDVNSKITDRLYDIYTPQKSE